MKKTVVAIVMGMAFILGSGGYGKAQMSHGGMGKGQGSQGGMMKQKDGMSGGGQTSCMMMGMRGMRGMGMMGMGRGMMGPMGMHRIFMKAVSLADTEKQKEALWALEKRTASQCAALMVEMMQHKDMMRESMMKEGCGSPTAQKHFQLMLQARDKMAKTRMKALADMERIIGKEKMKEVLKSGMMGMGTRN